MKAGRFNALLFATALLLPGVGGYAQEFLEVVVTDRFFESPKTRPALNVKLSQPHPLDAVILDTQGKVVRHVSIDEARTDHVVALSNLPPVSRGIYLFHLASRSAAGAVAVRYPANAGGGDFLPIDDCKWDTENRRVDYFLPRAACVRIRAGLADSAYLQEVLPWEAQQAGRHSVPWLTATNTPALAEMVNREDFQARVLALSLPANTLVDLTLKTNRFAGDNVPAVELPAHLEEFSRVPGMFTELRKRTKVSVADDYELTMKIEPVGSGDIINVRLDCAEKDRARLVNRRFEVMIFVDGQFVTEDELAIMPFNYRLATRGLAAGQHVITMNVLDFEGVPGTVSAVFEAGSNRQATTK